MPEIFTAAEIDSLCDSVEIDKSFVVKNKVFGKASQVIMEILLGEYEGYRGYSKIEFQNCSFTDLKIKDCTFKIPFEFKNCILNGNTEFNKCIFDCDFSFAGAIFHADVKFEKYRFDCDFSFAGAIFHADVKFEECIFDCDFSFKGSKFKLNTVFDKCIFNKRGCFDKIEVAGYPTKTYGTEFVILGSAEQQMRGKLSFKNAIFNGSAEFCNLNGIQFNLGEAVFEKSLFTRNVRFDIGSSFFNTKFLGKKNVISNAHDMDGVQSLSNSLKESGFTGLAHCIDDRIAGRYQAMVDDDMRNAERPSEKDPEIYTEKEMCQKLHMGIAGLRRRKTLHNRDVSIYMPEPINPGHKPLLYKKGDVETFEHILYMEKKGKEYDNSKIISKEDLCYIAQISIADFEKREWEAERNKGIYLPTPFPNGNDTSAYTVEEARKFKAMLEIEREKKKS